ncbi:hypothetical protein [Embleya hyalina]|uniref:pPIWI-associating nuclease domain-containing protein n=1 Tax=Embleya hyalina TaxID=516124 RepID=UPI000F83C0E6|nr:hypothetical protein [Embleya hyalina]
MDQADLPIGRADLFSVTARMVQDVVGFGALSSWRSSLDADNRIRTASGRPGFGPDLGRVSRHQVDLLDWVVETDPGPRLLGATSGRPILTWQRVVTDALDSPTRPAWDAMTLAGRTNLTLTGTDLLTAEDLDGDLADEAAEHVEQETLQPWQQARLDATDELYTALGDLDRTVPELLDGAWHTIRNQGPAAAVTIANCVVEAMDRSLRAAAPDDQVHPWHARNRRPSAEITKDGRPTRALRVNYVMRGFKGEAELVRAQIDALVTMTTRISNHGQKLKHASQGDITTARTLVCTVESLLMSLFLERL